MAAKYKWRTLTEVWGEDFTPVSNMILEYEVDDTSFIGVVKEVKDKSVRAVGHTAVSIGVALGFVQRHFRRLRAEAPATLASLRAHPDLMLEVMEAAI